ncbi:MAG: nicotinate-nucleotide adenylyltransferase [Anaerolineae bacterium]|nr:nicotinate-nucleotide adenylyltransferase [Anaerolineae bacterium]
MSAAPIRIGVFGGTFDPPHLGHLLLAENAADALGLTQVLFTPAADPPHKEAEAVSPAPHRVKMVELAIEDNPRFALARIDLDRPGPHYTADTMRLMQQLRPDADLYFLMGGDALRDFPKWHQPADILRYARLGVMRRPGAVIDLSKIEVVIPGITDHIRFVDAPEIGISATTIRERLHDGQSIRYQVTAKVERYIMEHHLYRNIP